MRKHNYVIALWLLICGVNVPKAQAQASVQAAGGTATGSGGSASYSVGQLTTTIASGPSGTSSPGVLQPFEISVLSSQSPLDVGLECSAYPNPTLGAINLRIEEPAVREYTWRLADLTGRKLAVEAFTARVVTISLADFPAGGYLLFVERKNTPFKTFKIIKQ